MINHIVLFSWPVVVLILFRRCSAGVAVAVSIVAGYLLLPRSPSFNPPLLPTIEKDTIPALAALVMAAALAGRASRPGGAAAAAAGDGILPGWLPRPLLMRLLLLLLLVGSFLTVLTNQDTIVRGGTVLRGERLYGAFSAILTFIMTMLPFVLARKFLSDDRGHRVLLGVLAVAGLVYSIPVLYEIRMSPQLSRMIYGYFPHDWIQHMRGGGFRPVVFLEHGLWLAIFMASAFLAALGLVRASSGETRRRYLFAAIWLFGTLAISHNLGALVIAICLGALLLLTSARIQILMAAVIAAIVLTYPILRGGGLVPTDRFLVLAEKVSIDRAMSLKTRFDNEDMLLERASERPLAGWSGWGRNRVLDEEGRDISITDGLWTLVIGQSGWIGYIGQFGLMGLPLILIALRRRRLGPGPETAALCLVLAAGMIDLIPNATRTPVTWLVAGALAGRLEWPRMAAAAAAPQAPAAAAGPEKGPRPSPQFDAGYTRQKHLHPRPGP